MLSTLRTADETALDSAVFGLYNKSGQKQAELVIGEDGSATYEKLPQGKYYLKELAAPEGYVLFDELIPFEIQREWCGAVRRCL